MGFWKRLRWLLLGWDGGYCSICGDAKEVVDWYGAWCPSCDK